MPRRTLHLRWKDRGVRNISSRGRDLGLRGDDSSGHIIGYNRVPIFLQTDEGIQKLYHKFINERWGRVYSFKEFIEIYKPRGWITGTLEGRSYASQN